MIKEHRILSYETMEQLTRRWWFYLLLVLVAVITPPFASKGLGPINELGNFVWDTVQALLIKKIASLPFMPILHLAVLILIFSIVRNGNRFRRGISIIIGLHFIAMAYFQTIAVSEKYGLSIISVGLILFLAVAFVWFWEASVGKTDFTFHKLPLRNYWVLPLALFAFWDPDILWDFDPLFLITSTSPIAICMMTTIYLAIMNLLFPRINFPVFRVMSFVGILLAAFTLLGAFFMDAREGSYWLFLHIPMLIISLYSFRRGLRFIESDPA